MESAVGHDVQLFAGDPKYRVPRLEPLLVDELSVQQGSSSFGLSFVARNSTIAGIKEVQVKDIRFDLSKQHAEFDLLFPVLTIHCRYNVSGKVLILPITGYGDGVLVLKGVDVKINYNFETVRRKDKIYGQPRDFKLYFDIQDMTIHLDNLFNGDKFLGSPLVGCGSSPRTDGLEQGEALGCLASALRFTYSWVGDNMNTFLNENWRELLKELGPGIGEAISKVVSTILANIFELVPYDEAFPEKASLQVVSGLMQSMGHRLDHVALNN
ncbi:Protein takeout [Zootermopsis nevadensis]|uniref:Protein takeout n=1 Tax=Zootermopsis nevadensis TaxID=136037 RepID=A0A067RJ17_ZOONE|nr:Protein takeout [Zootermopsis nevadensis]